MEKNYMYRSPLKSWHRAPKTLRIWILIWGEKKKVYGTIRKLWTRIISFVGCDHSGCWFSHSFASDSDTMDWIPPGSSVHGNFSGKITGMGCHFLLQGIFLTQVIMVFGPFFFSSLKSPFRDGMLKLLTDKIEVGTSEHFISFAQKNKTTNQP